MATADHIQIPEDLTEARKETVVGSTPTSVFDFSWPYFNAEDNKVYVDGVLQTTGYTLTPDETKEGGFLGGEVEFDVALTDCTVILERDVALSRQDDFEYPSNKLNIRALNTAFDRIYGILQQFRRLFKRTVRQPLSDTDEIGELPVAASRAGKLFGFDQDGNPVATSLGQTITVPMPIAEGGTGATTATAARTNLGLGTAATQDSTAFDAAGSAAAAQAASQPLDSDLTAIAALTTTAFGRALLELANAAALRSAAALGTAATQNTGTSGTNVPLLDGANSWSAQQTLAALLNLTSGQIAFPASQSASAGANTLDDYEEGTWTPTDGSGAGLSFTTDSNQYVKVGQLVIASFYITYPTTASAAQARVAGLPFTSQNTTTAVYGGYFSFKTITAVISLMLNQNSTTFDFFNDSGAARTNANMSGIQIRGVVVYRANA